jgi:hypothetical protein
MNLILKMKDFSTETFLQNNWIFWNTIHCLTVVQTYTSELY